jgi:hypothetical protein
MKTPNAQATSPTLPTAQIIRFPIENAAGKFDLSFKDWSGLYITLNVADQFTGMDDVEIDMTLAEMLRSFPREAENSVYHMVRKNGQVLDTLRKAVSFLAVMDKRLMAAANHILDHKAVR